MSGACTLDLVSNFDSVLGVRRGSKAQSDRELAPYLAELAAGELYRTMVRLHAVYFEEGPDVFDDGQPMRELLDAFAQQTAGQAAERWRPHMPWLLSTLGVTPTVELAENALQHLREWTVMEMTSDPSMFVDDLSLEWNAGYANARIGEGLNFTLGPIFRADPKRRVSAAVGKDAYASMDSRCQAVYGCSAAEQALKYDETSWGKMFDMLSEYDVSLDLQPGQVNAAQLKAALTGTFEALLNGDF